MRRPHTRQLALFTASLLFLHAGSSSATTITSDRSVAANKTFDYVIVGGGLSGITVGNKLSGKGYSVLIIEAGPDARDAAAVNNAEERSNLNGYCNWQYQAYDDSGNLLSWKIDSGMCLGGSTSINGMVWYRPTKAEINMLETLGNSGWNWNSLEPYMDAIEHFKPPNAVQTALGAGYDPSVHGYNGAVNVSFPTPMRIPSLVSLYKSALPSVFPGLNVGNDLSSRTSTISASTSWTIWYDPVSGKNKRSSAAHALLYAPNQQRNSLTVLVNYAVSKVVLSNDLKATGVVFGDATTGSTGAVSGLLYTVNARKEVILAAGSLASAPILERSGVGNKKILQGAGVKQLVDLPGVGMNLNDQPGTSASATVTSAFLGNTSIIDGRNLFAPDISLVNIDQIFTNSSSSVADSLKNGLKARAKAIYDAGAAASFDSALAVMAAATSLIINSKLPIAEFIGESYPGVLSAVWWPLLPLSRGHVHIASSAPLARPIVTPRLLSDSFDLQVSVTVARRSRQLFQSPAFSSLGLVDNVYADPASVGPNATDDDYAAFVKSSSFGASHWVGSTAMLPKKIGGVVDAKLKVYGTKNLRVVDAGIIPYAITSHTMSTMYAVAQKAADLILADA